RSAGLDVRRSLIVTNVPQEVAARSDSLSQWSPAIDKPSLTTSIALTRCRTFCPIMRGALPGDCRMTEEYRTFVRCKAAPMLSAGKTGSGFVLIAWFGRGTPHSKLFAFSIGGN